MFGSLTVMNSADKDTIYSKLSICVVLLLYFVHFYNVYLYAVDVPFWDEWTLLDPGRLDDTLSFRWLFSFHNEHRLVPTKLMIWLGLQLDDWNLVTQQMINYLLFGVLILSLFFVGKRVTEGAGGFPLYWAFLIFLTSPINSQNHSWGFQSQIHFVLLFIILAALYGFRSKIMTKNIALFTCFSIAAVYSFSLGLVIVPVLWFFFFLHLWRVVKEQPLTHGEKTAIVSGALIVAISMALWFVGYEKPVVQPNRVWPYTSTFWEVFLKQISYGFGFDTYNWWIGLFFLILIVFPLLGIFSRKPVVRNPSLWMLAALTAGLLASLAVITVGRGGYGATFFSRVSNNRYVEISFLLIPLTSLAWWYFLKEFKSARKYVLIAIWLACCWGYRDDWSYSDSYSLYRNVKLAGLGCIADYCRGNNDGNCISLNDDGPLVKRFEAARRLGLSFTKRLPRECQE